MSDSCQPARVSPDRVEYRCFAKVIVVLDFLMLVYGVGFFMVATLYVLACEKM